MEHWLQREIDQWIDLMTHRTMSERSYHRATSRSLANTVRGIHINWKCPHEYTISFYERINQKKNVYQAIYFVHIISMKPLGQIS